MHVVPSGVYIVVLIMCFMHILLLALVGIPSKVAPKTSGRMLISFTLELYYIRYQFSILNMGIVMSGWVYRFIITIHIGVHRHWATMRE
jgi:hypothetical protein